MARAKLGRATPQQAGAAWSAGFSGATQTVTDGVNATNKDWAQRTIAAKNAILAGIQAAFTSGRWDQGVQRTGTQGWKQAMLQKGIPHMATGATVGAAHYAAFRAQWDSFAQQAVAALPPRGSYEQNKQRSMQLQDSFHAAKGRFKGLWRGQAG
jgi:hypothetical protein